MKKAKPFVRRGQKATGLKVRQPGCSAYVSAFLLQIMHMNEGCIV